MEYLHRALFKHVPTFYAGLGLTLSLDDVTADCFPVKTSKSYEDSMKGLPGNIRPSSLVEEITTQYVLENTPFRAADMLM